MLYFLMSSSPTTPPRPPLLHNSAGKALSITFSGHQKHQGPLFSSFVFNSLRTLLQLGGRGRVGTDPDNKNSLYAASFSIFSAPLSPVFATLTESSILRSPQVLCLPLLRKLPGCRASLPILELGPPGHALPGSAPRFQSRPLPSFDFQLSTFNRPLALPLRFGRLVGLAPAAREVACLRQRGLFVHRAIHADVDALHVPAGAAGKYFVFSHSASPAYRPCTNLSTVFFTSSVWSPKGRRIAAESRELRLRIKGTALTMKDAHQAPTGKKPGLNAGGILHRIPPIHDRRIADTFKCISRHRGRTYFQLLIQKPTPVLITQAASVHLKDCEKLRKASILALQIKESSKT